MTLPTLDPKQVRPNSGITQGVGPADYQAGTGTISRIFDFLDKTVRRGQIALYAGAIETINTSSLGAGLKEMASEFVHMDGQHFTFEDVLNAGDVPEFWGRGFVEFAGDLIFDPIWLVPAGAFVKGAKAIGKPIKATTNFAGKLGYNGVRRILPGDTKTYDQAVTGLGEWLTKKKVETLGKIGVATTPEGKVAKLVELRLAKAERDMTKKLNRDLRESRKVQEQLAKKYNLRPEKVAHAWGVLINTPMTRWAELSGTDIAELASRESRGVVDLFTNQQTGAISVVNQMETITNTVRRGRVDADFFRELRGMPAELIDDVREGIIERSLAQLDMRGAERDTLRELLKAGMRRNKDELSPEDALRLEDKLDLLGGTLMSERLQYFTLALTKEGKDALSVAQVSKGGRTSSSRVMDSSSVHDFARKTGDLTPYEMNDLSVAGVLGFMPKGTKMFIEDPNLLDAIRTYGAYKTIKIREGITSIVSRFGYKLTPPDLINPKLTAEAVAAGKIPAGETVAAVEDLSGRVFVDFRESLAKRWAESGNPDFLPKEFREVAIDTLNTRVSPHYSFLEQVVSNYSKGGGRFHVSDRDLEIFGKSLKEAFAEKAHLARLEGSSEAVVDAILKQADDVDGVLAAFKGDLDRSFRRVSGDSPLIVPGGNQVLRKITEDADDIGAEGFSQFFDDFVQVKVEGFSDTFVPKEVGEILNRYWDVTNSPKDLKKLGTWIRSSTQAFKVTTLAPFPEYHVRNYFGNKFNMWLGGMTNVGENMALTAQSMQLAKLGLGEEFVSGSIRGIKTTRASGEVVSPFIGDIGMASIARKVLGDDAYAPSKIKNATDWLLDKSEKVLSGVSNMKKHSLKVGGGDITSLDDQVKIGKEVMSAREFLTQAIDDGAWGTGLFSSEMAKALKGVSTTDDFLAKIKGELFGAEGSITGDMLAAGSLVESVDRMVLYAWARNTARTTLRKKTGNIEKIVAKEGDTFLDREEAMRFVNRYLFNYDNPDELTKWFRDFSMPFFTWSRYNIPLQLEHLVINPEKAALINKFRIGIERAASADTKDDRRYVAEWARQGMAIRTRREANGEYSFYTMQNWLPFADLSEVGVDEMVTGNFSEGISEFKDFWVNQMTPIVKAPIEGVIGYNFWKGRLNLPEKRRFLGMNMSERSQNAIRNIRALSVMDRFIQPFFADTDSSFGEQIIRTMGVPRSQTLNLSEGQRRHILETKAEIRKLSSALRRSLRKGNQAAAKDLWERIQKLQEERLTPERTK